MSAKNENVLIPAGDEWTRLTDSSANVTHISVQNVGKGDLIIMGTAGTAPLDGDADGRRVGRGEALDNVPLSDLFPGVNAGQVWARSLGTATEVYVAHEAIPIVADKVVIINDPASTEIELLTEIYNQLQLLNARFEEAFNTGINLEDNENGDY